MYDNVTSSSQSLTIPHKHFTERDFTLLPANNLLSDYKYPEPGKFYNKTINEINDLQKIDTNKCWPIKTKLTIHNNIVTEI